jgi:hypothetical protein
MSKNKESAKLQNLEFSFFSICQTFTTYIQTNHYHTNESLLAQNSILNVGRFLSQSNFNLIIDFTRFDS